MFKVSERLIPRGRPPAPAKVLDIISRVAALGAVFYVICLLENIRIMHGDFIIRKKDRLTGWLFSALGRERFSASEPAYGMIQLFSNESFTAGVNRCPQTPRIGLL